MDWKEFDYSAQYSGDGAVLYRPIVSIQVLNGNASIEQLAMIDSGTDRVLMNAEIAVALGIDPEDCEKIKVAGLGKSEGFACEMKITFPDFDKTFVMSVGFVEGLPFGVLLGQRDFFEYFRIRFEKDRRKFLLALSPVANKH